ncbi:OmpA family protein [Sandaracinobacteroides saxicola]|uniref:OmpA family protein n=1 Tax=Sandaracinobacteroides saxicola TaxID=2759707 RepID=A0A7G5IL15_9SPHN|nr:OmpA family protein [Sandaracinobacteroides saxicola]QMW24057.1 OmpA family protein [Sandaracinobacteroides saxicola]
MPMISTPRAACALIALMAVPFSASLAAPQQEPPQQTGSPAIVVQGEALPDTSAMTKGPEIKGIISARQADRIKVVTPDGQSTVVFINEATEVKTGGLFASRNKQGTAALLSGLPVSVKTMQAGSVLLASQVTFRNNDLKTATMIRTGTAERFAEQAAATEALRGRMGDIDKYNIKSTTNVNFDTGKAVLSEEARASLCAAASQAESVDNALMLVVGYTDSVGDEAYNQRLSEKRAASVINYLQQVCRWKPYRMLTPTGMAEADPLASNDTPEGKAQNRRVSVNVLVSKSVDGM